MKQEGTGQGEPAPKTRLLLNLGRAAVWLGAAAWVAAIPASGHLTGAAMAAGAGAIVTGLIIIYPRIEQALPAPPSRKGPEEPNRGPWKGRRRRGRPRPPERPA